jgi:hypothetical protein
MMSRDGGGSEETCGEARETTVALTWGKVLGPRLGADPSNNQTRV